MRTSVALTSFGIALLAGATSAKAGDPFWRNGHLCQRASSGYVVCRDPRDHSSNGHVVGGRPRYDREWQPDESEYDGYGTPGGEVCQRASSGYVVCRDPRDHWSNGYVVGR